VSLQKFSAEVRLPIENELKQIVNRIEGGKFTELHGMLAYHLGWEGEGAGEKAQGKRIRPQMVLLATAAAGNDWKNALGAAAAVELVHNFSLIHDDIEDRSEYRHGRKTVWALWGEAQAINTGDCMYSLAFNALLGDHNKAENVVSAVNLLQDTCVTLTKGQFLDMAYETKDNLPLDAYWTMVGGKTAALLACSAAIGAIITGSNGRSVEALKAFGWNLGLAFQAQDDWLGIWGDSALTGKSTDSDLLSGKKSLPVILGLMESPEFMNRWRKRPFTAEEIPELAALLKDTGIQNRVDHETVRLTEKAKAALASLDHTNQAVADLDELADSLLNRRK
jgi:geranylgeranyl diphosphate synthase type I